MITTTDLEQGRASIKKILDGNVMLRSALIALKLYDKAIWYLPELLLIIADNPRGKEIINELGLDQPDSLFQNGRSK